MKKFILILFGFTLSISLFSQDKGFGIGIIAGEPTGLSAKMWTSENTALDAAFAWSFVGSGFLRIHADMLVHKYFIDVNAGQLPVYFGLGAKIGFISELELGMRIPVGIVYILDSAPIDIFLEIVPGLNFLPELIIDLDAALGVRYYF